MSDFYNKLNKNNKNDFNQDSLPVNRRELFKKIFVSRFGKLFQINIFTFLFFIPLLLWDMFTNIYKSSLKDLSELTQFVLYIKSPLFIVFTLIAFVGIAGAIYYIRRLSWKEPVSLFRTFFEGVKNSIKQFMIFGFVTAIFICLCDLAFTMMINTNLDKTYNIIFISSMILAIVLFLSIISYALTLSSLYVMKISTIVKTSVILTIKKMMLNLFFSIVTYGIILATFILNIVYLYFIGIVVLAVIGISYSILVWVIYTNSSYDLYINLKQYPEIYRKGLRPLKKEGAKGA